MLVVDDQSTPPRHPAGKLRAELATLGKGSLFGLRSVPLLLEQLFLARVGESQQKLIRSSNNGSVCINSCIG